MQQPEISQELATFDLLPDSARVPLSTVCALWSVHRQTVWRWCKDGHFPKPEKTGSVSRWVVGDLRRQMARGQ